MEISLESAQKVDIEIIYTFCKDLIEAYETDPVDLDRVLPWCKRKITASIEEYRRILKDDAVVGYIHICPPENDTVELDDFYLYETFRGQGIGSEVIKELCKDADAKGQTLLLYVFKKNERAVKLYERHGFVIADEAGNSRWIMTREAK